MTTLGARVGFRIEDLASGQSEVMAHVDHREGPRVGKHRVDVEAVDRISELALGSALEAADVIVIDEIAPMEVFSEVFVEQARACLDAEQPVLAAIHRNATEGFIGEVEWPAAAPRAGHERGRACSAGSGGRSSTEAPTSSHKARSDVQLVPVGRDNRDELPAELAERVSRRG